MIFWRCPMCDTENALEEGYGYEDFDFRDSLKPVELEFQCRGCCDGIAKVTVTLGLAKTD